MTASCTLPDRSPGQAGLETDTVGNGLTTVRPKSVPGAGATNPRSLGAEAMPVDSTANVCPVCGNRLAPHRVAARLSGRLKNSAEPFAKEALWMSADGISIALANSAAVACAQAE